MHCVTQKLNVGFLWMEKNKIDVDPPYQRESGIWALEKKQLFIDSLINRFDVPKIYLHDKTAEDTPFSFSVIDGKQRLDAIWSFMEGNFPLAPDFRYLGDGGSDGTSFIGGTYYSKFSEHQKEMFKNVGLDVVLVMRSDADDIEELFSRLNNGEPLNAAEKRNAIGGEMLDLVIQFSQHPFFQRRLGFSNKRMSHREVAAKILRLELTDKNGGGDFCDLKKKFLDELVAKNKTMSAAEKQGLASRVNKRLNDLDKIFSDRDPLLAKQSYPQLYYGWVKQVTSNYAADNMFRLLHDFLDRFQQKRLENFNLPEEERDAGLVEYGRLTQQGTNDLASMETRARLLTKHLLLDHPELTLKDPSRHFTDDERFVIWIQSGKECSLCQIKISFEEMEADHVHAWSKGGPTNLANAQGLCIPCNRKKGSGRLPAAV